MDIYCRALQAADDNTVRRMPFEYCTPKAKNTISEYVKFIAFPQQQGLRERATMLRYTYNGCRFLRSYFPRTIRNFLFLRYI